MPSQTLSQPPQPRGLSLGHPGWGRPRPKEQRPSGTGATSCPSHPPSPFPTPVPAWPPLLLRFLRLFLQGHRALTASPRPKARLQEQGLPWLHSLLDPDSNSCPPWPSSGQQRGSPGPFSHLEKKGEKLCWCRQCWEGQKAKRDKAAPDLGLGGRNAAHSWPQTCQHRGDPKNRVHSPTPRSSTFQNLPLQPSPPEPLPTEAGVVGDRAQGRAQPFPTAAPSSQELQGPAAPQNVGFRWGVTPNPPLLPRQT